VAFLAKAPVDPTISPSYPKDSFHEDTLVIDCKKSIQGISESRIVTQSRAVLSHFTYDDPKIMDLSKGTVIPPGSIAATAKKILCDEKNRTPLVTKKQLAALNSADATEEKLASMSFFELDRNNKITVYYQAIQNEGTSKAEEDAIVVMIPQVELRIADEAYGPGLSLDLGTFKTEVYWQRFRCEERKSLMLKSELYDASNDLKFITAADLAQPTWAEFKESAPLGNLRRILCGPQQVQK
jgi:hypothetical protein